MYNFGIVGKPNCFVSVTKLNLANEMKNPKEAKNVIYFCKKPQNQNKQLSEEQV